MNAEALRILVTCDWFSPLTGGGAERVAFEVSKRLAARGHQITILATRPRGQQPFEMPAGIDLVTIPAYSLSGLVHAQMSMSPGLMGATAKVLSAQRPHVILSHSLQFQTTLAAALSARRRRTPFVVTAHIADLRAIRGPMGLAARGHEGTLGRLVLRLAARAIAVSQPVATHLRTLSPRLAIDIVANGVDLERFQPADPMPHAGLRIGFLGRLVTNKGADVAVRAVADAIGLGCDASLSIAGEGPEEGSLRRLATRLGVAERVHFEGHLARPEVWLHGIDVLVRPSLTEGMPLGVLEAMAAGVPVIASDVPGNASILGPEEIGLLVPPRDHHAVARAVARLSRDPGLRSRMRAAGIDAASAFSWDITTDRTYEALLRAIDGFSPAGWPSVAATGRARVH